MLVLWRRWGCCGEEASDGKLWVPSYALGGGTLLPDKSGVPPDTLDLSAWLSHAPPRDGDAMLPQAALPPPIHSAHSCTGDSCALPGRLRLDCARQSYCSKGGGGVGPQLFAR